MAQREKVVKVISDKTKSFSKQSLKSILEEHSVPVGVVNKLNEVFQDPQVIKRKLKIERVRKTDIHTPIISNILLLSFFIPFHFKKICQIS